MRAKAVGWQLIESWRRKRLRRRALRNREMMNRADRGEVSRANGPPR